MQAMGEMNYLRSLSKKYSVCLPQTDQATEGQPQPCEQRSPLGVAALEVRHLTRKVMLEENDQSLHIEAQYANAQQQNDNAEEEQGGVLRLAIFRRYCASMSATYCSAALQLSPLR